MPTPNSVPATEDVSMSMPSVRRRAAAHGSRPVRARSEPRAVLRGGDADEFPEAAPQRLLVGESAVARDLLESRCALLDPAPRLLDALVPHEGGRARAEPRPELPREVPRAHAHAPREALDGQVGTRVLEHPQFQLAEEVVALLRLEVSAELGLAARPLEVQHELLRNGERHCL